SRPSAPVVAWRRLDPPGAFPADRARGRDQRIRLGSVPVTTAGQVDTVVIGGCGRVGLPLGIALASRGLSVTLYDINAAAVATVNDGVLPFAEDGAAAPLVAAV